MSELALRTRDRRQVWARPGSAHDRRVRLAGIVLPTAIGALAAILVIAPLTTRGEISFVLAKDKVEVAAERMRGTGARYRGADDKGQPFQLRAGSAVQRTSKVPVVEMSDISAEITLADGPARLVAPRADYNLDQERMQVVGPLRVEGAGGYKISTRDVGVDLKTRSIASNARVDGRMPLGSFSADRMRADLDRRTVTLDGRARLRIEQGRVRAR